MAKRKATPKPAKPKPTKEHDHETRGCKYLGNNAWSCGHVDQLPFVPPAVPPADEALHKSQDLAHRTQRIRAVLTHHGPLYIRAVGPRSARHDMESNSYGYWYVGHLDYAFLEDEQLMSYVSEYDGNFAEGLEGFMGFLESKGYVVLHSFPAEGAAIIDFGEDY